MVNMKVVFSSEGDEGNKENKCVYEIKVLFT